MIRIFWLFMLYSFLGFLLETGYALARAGKLVNRKTMLVLPLCPVYGLGGTAIVLLSEALPASPLILALVGTLACTAIEYVYGLLCETLLFVRLWDYGNGKGSVHGRIHLLFCVYWGALSLLVPAWIQPLIERIASALPDAWFPWASALLLSDAVATVMLLRRFGRGGERMPGCPVARRVHPQQP